MRAFLLVASLLVADDSPEPPDKAPERLEGRWVSQRKVVSGSEDSMGKTTLVIKGKHLSWTYEVGNAHESKKSTITFTFKVDASKRPGHIDLVPTEGTLKGKVFPSIYQLDKDTLKLCRSQPGKERPKDFTSKKGSDHWLLILKRQTGPDVK